MIFDKTIKYILCLLMILMGVNHFVPVLPAAPLSTNAAEFLESMAKTEYLIPLIALFEIVCGLLLLNRNTTPLGAILLFPFTLNLFLFNLFMNPSTVWISGLIFLSNLYLIYRNRDFYSPLIFSITNGKNITLKQLRENKFSLK